MTPIARGRGTSARRPVPGSGRCWRGTPRLRRQYRGWVGHSDVIDAQQQRDRSRHGDLDVVRLQVVRHLRRRARERQHAKDLRNAAAGVSSGRAAARI